MIAAVTNIVRAAIVAVSVSNGVARLTVPTSGCNALPFVTLSPDLRTWTQPEQTRSMVSSWHWVVATPARGGEFFRGWYEVESVE